MGIPAHGIQGVIGAGLALEDGQVGLEAVLELSQHLLTGGSAEYGEQAAAFRAGTLNCLRGYGCGQVHGMAGAVACGSKAGAGPASGSCSGGGAVAPVAAASA